MPAVSFVEEPELESVAMVELLPSETGSFNTDQILMVSGKLALNSTNIKKLAFVIEEATIVEIEE